MQLTRTEGVTRSAQAGYEQTTAGALGRRYRRAGVACQELEQPNLDELRQALASLRPTVVHLVSNLVENGPAALHLGSRRGQCGARPRFPERPPAIPAGELAVLAGLEPAPLVILDTPTPPVYSERLRQLFLRNEFAAESASATSAPPTAILGTGLGGQELQDELASQLMELLHAGRPVVTSARASGAGPAASDPAGRGQPQQLRPQSCGPAGRGLAGQRRPVHRPA